MKGVEFMDWVNHGKLSPKTRVLIATYLAKMEGKAVVVSLRQQTKRRSLRQNRYYWGCVLPLVLQMFQECGNEMNQDEVHEYLKKYVWGWTRTVINPDGEIKTITNSSANLSTLDWEVAMEKTRAFAAQYNVEIPLPNEGVPTDEKCNDDEETTGEDGQGSRDRGTEEREAP